MFLERLLQYSSLLMKRQSKILPSYSEELVQILIDSSFVDYLKEFESNICTFRLSSIHFYYLRNDQVM